jgi:acyl carrier protein
MSHSDAIKKFVLDEFLPDVSPDDLSVDHDLLADGAIDSLGMLMLIAWVEDHFDLSIDGTALDPNSFRSIAAIDGFVRDATRTKVAGG